MEKASVLTMAARENLVIVLLAVIAVGVLIVILMAANIIPAAKTVSTQPPAGGGTVAPSPNQTQPFKNEQQAGSDIGAPVVNPITNQQLGVKCPADLCTSPSYGSSSSKCPGSNETYYEQYCYRYPEYANSLLDCDSQRTCYLSKCGVDSGSC